MEGYRIMELPVAKNRPAYTKAMNLLQAELQTETEEGQQLATDQLEKFQSKLDAIAAKYQNDEELGSIRYKLYELQALLHYFRHNDQIALEFINTAISVRGASYPKAERLIGRLNQIKSPERLTKAERRKKLIGVEGWLAWFIVGLMITTIITIFNFFNDGFLSNSDVNTINQYQSGLGDSVQLLANFENIALVIYVALLVVSIVSVLRHRRISKTIVIITLLFGTLYSIADYTMGSSLFSAPDLAQYVQPALEKAAGDAGRGTIAAIVWIPYFLISKRVRATLTKK